MQSHNKSVLASAFAPEEWTVALKANQIRECTRPRCRAADDKTKFFATLDCEDKDLSPESADSRRQLSNMSATRFVVDVAICIVSGCILITCFHMLLVNTGSSWKVFFNSASDLNFMKLPSAGMKLRRSRVAFPRVNVASCSKLNIDSVH